MKNSEKPKFDDKKLETLLLFLEEHAETFRRQGFVAETWRTYRGRRRGPFYHLRYREGPRQCCVHLGRDRELADAVRARLQEMQAALRAQRAEENLWAWRRAQAREVKSQFERELRKIGLWLKGYEVRGGRA